MQAQDRQGRLYWGDLHNHGQIGLYHYAKGSLARAIDIAREHLDFFAFTGHSQWHDMPRMVNDAHLKWKEGFDWHAQHWPRTKELIRAANRPGEFVALLGYEWHSARHGDRNILFRDDEGELITTAELAELEAYAGKVGAVLYPHHIGYKTNLPGRGLNWEYFNPELSPLIEIVSEHGCAERDRGPWPYISHSNGPRTTGNTYQHALAMGLHCGVAGGSDDHLGFPGAYGEGLLGVYARELTREGIFEALSGRRTLAATGDRIAVDFSINDGFIGDILSPAGSRHVTVRVKAWDEIDKIELIKNNRVLRRHFPDRGATQPAPLPGKRLFRIEYGWGPWSALGMPRTADWEVHVQLTGRSRILAFEPCLQSAPFDEQRRHRIGPRDARNFHWVSYTARAGAYHEIPTNAVVLELQAHPDDKVRLTLAAPTRRRVEYSIADLEESSQVEFTGDFPSESFLAHRLVPAELYSAGFEIDDTPGGKGEDFYYVRVTQSNGHMAWCSPIWVRP